MVNMWRDWLEVNFETLVKLDSEWAKAFERLPAKTKSVSFDLGECLRDKRDKLGVVDILYRKIAKKAPGAARGITSLMCDRMLSDLRLQWVECYRRFYEQELNEMEKARFVTQS